MTTLDARGYSCPEPMVMLKKALKTEKELTLLVDNKASFENCEYYAERSGYAVVTTVAGGEWSLHLKAKS